MHLYDCRLGEFIPQATTGQIADRLRARFFDRLDQRPSESEVRSWKNSLGAFAAAVDGVGMDDTWIVLEYQLPLASSRIDCMILGRDQHQRPHDVLIEFKQWDNCAVAPIPDVVLLGNEQHLHPCAQVRSYRNYLADAHSAFADGKIGLSSCAYLHNVRQEMGSPLFALPYATLLADSPAFSAETVDSLARFVGEKTRLGATEQLVDAVLRGRYCPSKKLLDHVADTIEGYEPWRLIDDQLITFNEIMAQVEQAKRSRQKQVIIAIGGPGTGKSVIAIQVVGAAARRRYVVAHATGSKAFTTNLRGIVGRTEPFRYYMEIAKAEYNSLDLVVCDEAHRLRERSDTVFGKVISERPQHEDIIHASLVSVFLLDEHQSVRPNEIGSVPLIEEYARQQGIPVSKHDLRTQFRCAGSDSYVRWIEHVLHLEEPQSLAWKRNDEYEVRIFDNMHALEAALRDRREQGNTARIVAGFCWPWSKPLPNGELVHDVVIDTWSKPWNRKPKNETPARNPYKIWATEPRGFEEVGCIYSAQGFEFDYVGVIWGSDLQWNPASQSWVPNLAANKDSNVFKRGLTKNPRAAVEKLSHIYRVLSTRGMKGTYFYFLDGATRRRFERMMEG